MLPAEATRERRGALIDLRPLALAAVLAATAASGCGDEESPPPPADAGATGETALTITVDPDGPGEQEAQSAEVTCDEDGAGDPACAALEGVTATDLGPTPPDVACTEIFGGPDEVRVSGTLNGEPVEERLTRANGCEIDRFDALVPTLDALFPDYTPGQALQSGY